MEPRKCKSKMILTLHDLLNICFVSLVYMFTKWLCNKHKGFLSRKARRRFKIQTQAYSLFLDHYYMYVLHQFTLILVPFRLSIRLIVQVKAQRI